MFRRRIIRTLLCVGKNIRFVIYFIEVEKENLEKSKDVEYGVLKQLERAAIQSKLDPAEKIVRVCISKEKFSSKNGMLTNT